MPASRSSRLRAVKTQLVKRLELPTVDVSVVEAIAGDRQMTAAEKRFVDELRKARGEAFCADLLFALTHHHYPYEVGELFWPQILRHRDKLNQTLGRNVGVAVAALDFLHNIEQCFDGPSLISQQRMTDISELALRDSLTGLYDHTSFEMWLDHEVRCYARYRTPVALILIDLDEFKGVNDSHGHQEGDWALVEIGNIIRQVIRNVDLAARYGGEEFAVVLSHSEVSEAAAVAERLREQIERGLRKLRLTASLGVAGCPQDAKTTSELVACADEALYHSKRNGKNRVTIYSSIRR